MSDTSIGDGRLDDGNFSLDEDEAEGDTTAALLENARQSVNLPARSQKRAAVSSATGPAKKQREGAAQPLTTRASSSASRQNQETRFSQGKSVNFLNSDKWDKDVRPPHLMDDDVFNTLSVEAAAQHIMQWMTTKAMMDSNQIKENKAIHRGGKEKPDQEIKMLKFEAGEDNAGTVLHKQRFAFRTPLQEPKDYWHLMPVSWKEVNKSLYLDNVGMDNICSPRTLELLHNRASPLEIKMFLTLNISVGRSGVSKKQNLRTLEDGSTEVVSSDDWLSPTTISQVIEALDNLVAIWCVMWPGEWSMVTLRRAVTKHLAFGDITNVELRKKMLEAFINEVLTGNASLAARGKPPMEFEKVDKLCLRYLDNKRHYERSFKVEEPRDKVLNKGTKTRTDMDEMKRRVGNLKTASGKQVCFFYNSDMGCKGKACLNEHSCCFVRNGRMCGKSHKKNDHYKN